jgi:hypothetical protein
MPGSRHKRTAVHTTSCTPSRSLTTSSTRAGGTNQCETLLPLRLTKLEDRSPPMPHTPPRTAAPRQQPPLAPQPPMYSPLPFVREPHRPAALHSPVSPCPLTLIPLQSSSSSRAPASLSPSSSIAPALPLVSSASSWSSWSRLFSLSSSRSSSPLAFRSSSSRSLSGLRDVERSSGERLLSHDKKRKCHFPSAQQPSSSEQGGKCHQAQQERTGAGPDRGRARGWRTDSSGGCKKPANHTDNLRHTHSRGAVISVRLTGPSSASGCGGAGPGRASGCGCGSGGRGHGHGHGHGHGRRT